MTEGRLPEAGEATPKNRPPDGPRMAQGRAGWRPLAALALLPLLLAGCSGRPLVPPGIPVDASGHALPTLEGVVVDEGIHPLAGATVRFLGTGVAATTDGEGHYAIQRPTGRAEATLVTAAMPGFVPKTQQVQVSGRTSAHLDFALEADATLVPHLDLLKYTGTLRCAVGVAGAGQQTGLDCDPDRRDDHDVLPPWLWEIDPTPNLAGAVVEVSWQAQSPAAEVLHATLTAPMAGGRGGEVVADAAGPSPLRLEVPRAVAEAMPRWTAIRLAVDVAEGDTPGAASQDQRFSAVAALFYVEPAPPGYQVG